MDVGVVGVMIASVLDSGLCGGDDRIVIASECGLLGVLLWV